MRAAASAPRFERYVAIGDSTVEGLDDPLATGGFRGWADRLAERIAREQGSLLYANLAVRGRTTREVLEGQLAPAVAMRPDLAIVVAGTNDLLRRRFDDAALQRDMEVMQRAFRDIGATVLTFTLPDLSDIMPLARMLRQRLLRMNAAIRRACEATGTLLCDFARYPVASDPRLWSHDRLHANAAGHERMSEALAFTLGLTDDESWSRPLAGAPDRSFNGFVRAEAAWARTHLIPWIWRHARGISSGDGVSAKRPQLEPVVVEL